MEFKTIKWASILILSTTLTACNYNKTSIEAITPPMGWNSYDCYGMSVTEAEVKANAQYMATNLKEFGYQYVVVDFLWFGEGLTQDNWQSKTAPQCIDEFGRAIPSISLHPSSANGKGFKPLADYVHSLGLKFGIHIMRGIPWNAIAKNTPIKGSSFTAKDIASIYDTCAWHGGMRGINFEKDGAQQYINSLFELYASWGVDFVKVDDIAFPYHADDIEAVHKAVINCGRPMVISLSPGAAPVGSAKHLAENADMWRISPDFWDSWTMLKRQFGLARMWAPHAKAGSWPDADMLPVGQLAIRSEIKDNHPRTSRFTQNEQYSMITLWSMMRSPLMIGSNLPGLDSFTLALLTNKEVIDINQNSKNGKELFAHGDTIIWYAENKNGLAKYLALFNHNDSISKTISANLSDINVSENETITDLWNKKEVKAINNKVAVVVEPHGTALLKISTK